MPLRVLSLSSDDWTGNLRGSNVSWTSMKCVLQSIKTEETAILPLEAIQRRLRAESSLSSPSLRNVCEQRQAPA